MQPPTRREHDPQPGQRPPDVEVRYWAAARAAAGVPAERVPAGSLRRVLEAARVAHAATPRFAEVLAVCSVLVDEHPVGGRDHATVDVPAGSTVDLLPPFAGGSGRRFGTSAR